MQPLGATDGLDRLKCLLYLVVFIVLCNIEIRTHAEDIITPDPETSWLEPAAPKKPPRYQFKRYSYRKKSREARALKKEEKRCKSNCEALQVGHRHSPVFFECVKRCLSNECYDELYSHDEYEDGEVDVRSKSFMGCYCEKARKKRKNQRNP